MPNSLHLVDCGGTAEEFENGIFCSDLLDLTSSGKLEKVATLP